MQKPATAAEPSTFPSRTKHPVRNLVLSAALLSSLCSVAFPQTYEEKINASMKRVESAIDAGPFSSSWASLENYKVPEWYQDAKFGIFIHWGPYSVPAFDNEWYSRNMYQQDSVAFKHHVATYGPQNKFGYKDLIPLFQGEKFDADRWAQLFRDSGAKYVVPVAEHHDGFAMYDTALAEWSAPKMGPRRDVVGELASAIRKQGLHFGLSSHRAEHYWFFDGGLKFESDVTDPRYASLYGPPKPQEAQPDDAFLRDWLARSEELVDKYKPELVYFDWWIGQRDAFRPYVQKFFAFYYNRAAQWKRGVVINYKDQAFPEKSAVLDVERGQLGELRPLFWQTDTSVSWKSWCYVENDDYKSAESLVQLLVDVASKNGTLLLNVGPKSDGTIPEQAERTLRGIGGWLKVNGEAIYGTRPWTKFGEGPTQPAGGAFKESGNKPFTSADIRFTKKGNTLYAIALKAPEDGKLTIRSLAAGAWSGSIKQVRLLGSNEKIKWHRNAEGLTLELPYKRSDSFAVAVAITTTQ